MQLDDLTTAPCISGDSVERHDHIILTNKCHDNFPQVTDGKQLIEISKQFKGIGRAEGSMLSGTAQDIAVGLGEPEYHVRQALIFLEN